MCTYVCVCVRSLFCNGSVWVGDIGSGWNVGFALPPVLESRCSPRETWPRLEDYVSQVTDGKGV